MTSTELQLKLLNVARSSLKELRADYEDYLRTRHLTVWDGANPRYDTLLKFCRQHNKVSDYEPFFDRWGDEEQFEQLLNEKRHLEVLLQQARGKTSLN